MSNHRFSILAVVLLVGSLVLTCPTSTVADDDETNPGAKTSALLVGPFSFGDFYKKAQAHEELVKFMGGDKSPSEESVVKALQACQFFVRDQSVMRANGTWGFNGVSDKLPLVLVGGDVQFVVPNPGGQQIEIQLVKPDRLSSHTETFDDSSNSWRGVRIAMRCRLKSTSGLDTTWNIHGLKFAVTYDVNGKMVQPVMEME